MQKFIIITIVLASLMTGCALLNKAAPSQTDSNGQVLPGTHTATPITNDAAGAIPYGGVALSLVLLITNFLEKVRADKNGKGLIATVKAIEQAGNDPATKDAVAVLKQKLSDAHDLTNTQPIIKDILAKI